MQRLFFLIAIVLFFHPVEVYAQNALRAITEVEYYDFYNSIVNPDSITKFNLEYSASFGDTFSATTDDIPMLIGVSKEELFKNGISEQDIQFMNIQIVKGDKYKWKANRIAGSRILHATNKKRDYKHYSIPLFSSDKSKCIVMVESHRSNRSIYDVQLYTRMNGAWILSTQLSGFQLFKRNSCR